MPLAALPLLPNGKVNRKAMPEVDLRKQDDSPYQPPENHVELQIQHIWHEVCLTPCFARCCRLACHLQAAALRCLSRGTHQAA